MNRPLLVFAVLVGVGTVAVGAYVAVPGGGEEEAEPQAAATPASTLVPTTSASPDSTAAATSTAPPTPAPSNSAIPSNWAEYTDPLLGFKLRYPPDLVGSDSGVFQGQRAVVFRSPADPKRPGFTVGTIDNSAGLSLVQWVHEFTACLPDTVKQVSVDGQPGLSCLAQPEEKSRARARLSAG